MGRSSIEERGSGRWAHLGRHRKRHLRAGRVAACTERVGGGISDCQTKGGVGYLPMFSGLGYVHLAACIDRYWREEPMRLLRDSSGLQKTWNTLRIRHLWWRRLAHIPMVALRMTLVVGNRPVTVAGEAVSGAPGGRTSIGNVSGSESMAVMGAAGWDVAAGNGSVTTDNGAQNGGSKGQMTGRAAGTDEAKGKGGHCSAEIIGRAWGDSGGDGSRSTVGGSGTGTAVMGGDGAWAGNDLGQMTGAIGGIDRGTAAATGDRAGTGTGGSGAWGRDGVKDFSGAAGTGSGWSARAGDGSRAAGAGGNVITAAAGSIGLGGTMAVTDIGSRGAKGTGSGLRGPKHGSGAGKASAAGSGKTGAVGSSKGGDGGGARTEVAGSTSGAGGNGAVKAGWGVGAWATSCIRYILRIAALK
jgi:hypothetical protein